MTFILANQPTIMMVVDVAKHKKLDKKRDAKNISFFIQPISRKTLNFRVILRESY